LLTHSFVSDGWNNIVQVNAADNLDRELIKSIGPYGIEYVNAENGSLSWIGTELYYLWVLRIIL
jgi:hypothetical protein